MAKLKMLTFCHFLDSFIFLLNNCGFQKKGLPLRSYSGSVVQLNRMSDSGSEDPGFESQRSHRGQVPVIKFLLKKHDRYLSLVIFTKK